MRTRHLSAGEGRGRRANAGDGRAGTGSGRAGAGIGPADARTAWASRVPMGAAFGVLAVLLAGCGAGTEDGAQMEDGAEGGSSAIIAPPTGPVDGHDLPPADLERVQVGDPAPDFVALNSAGDRVTLSDFRGEKNVVLFFYRGHW